MKNSARDGLDILVEEKCYLLQDLLRHFVGNGALIIMRNVFPLLKDSRKYMVHKTLLNKLPTLILKMMKASLKHDFQI